MHGEELKGGQPGGSGSWAREGALPCPAPAPQGRQGSAGPTGLSVASAFPLHPKGQPTWWQIWLGQTFTCPFSPMVPNAVTPGAVQIARSPVGAPAGATRNKD